MYEDKENNASWNFWNKTYIHLLNSLLNFWAS